jgi:pimeloyl-ACP methyl ester carboxylesterase
MTLLARIALSLAFIMPLAGATLPAQAEEPWQTLPDYPPMPKPVDSRIADINGIKLYFAIYGAGDPVILLLHGGLGHSDVWGFQIPALAKRYRVITVDSRGHGRSTRNEASYSYQLMADDVLALLDWLEIPRASIVGWSDGGIIGLDIAMRHPERLEKLFVFGANYSVSGVKTGFEDDPVFGAYIERSAKDYVRLSPTPDDFKGFVDAVVEMWMTQPEYSAAQLGSIRTPTVIADGEHDEAIKPQHTKEMASLIPGADLVIFPGGSHFAFLQDPEAFNKAVLKFLDAE